MGQLRPKIRLLISLSQCWCKLVRNPNAILDLSLVLFAFLVNHGMIAGKLLDEAASNADVLSKSAKLLQVPESIILFVSHKMTAFIGRYFVSCPDDTTPD